MTGSDTGSETRVIVLAEKCTFALSPGSSLGILGIPGGTGHPRVLVAGIFYVGWQVDAFPKVNGAQPFIISNVMAHLYRCGNDTLFSSISFQIQR